MADGLALSPPGCCCPDEGGGCPCVGFRYWIARVRNYTFSINCVVNLNFNGDFLMGPGNCCFSYRVGSSTFLGYHRLSFKEEGAQIRATFLTEGPPYPFGHPWEGQRTLIAYGTRLIDTCSTQPGGGRPGFSIDLEPLPPDEEVITFDDGCGNFVGRRSGCYALTGGPIDIQADS